jgi:hypothetical protein
MPTQKSAFETLQLELTYAHILWRTYNELFTGSPGTVALLNQTAGSFFGLVQDMLVNEMVLALSRLGDETKGTLTFRTLLKEKKVGVDPPQFAAAELAYKDYIDACKPVKHWRNNRVAHTNFNVARGLDALGSLKGADVVKALEVGVRFLEFFNPHPKDPWDYNRSSNTKAVLIAAVRARLWVRSHLHDEGFWEKEQGELKQIQAMSEAEELPLPLPPSPT